MDIGYIKASDGTGEVPRMTVTADRAATAMTLTVSAITNLPAKFIAVVGTYNASTKKLTAGTVTVFKGHTAAGAIEIDGFAPGYTDIGNTIGQIVVIKPTTYWADMVADALAVSFNADGSIKTTVLDALVLDALGTGKTATNLRVKPRAYETASTSTLTPNIDSFSVYRITALAAAMTIAAPAGTPNPNDVMLILIKDNGTARALTWNAAFTNISGVDSLTTTVATKWHAIGAVYDATSSKWQIISITTGA